MALKKVEAKILKLNKIIAISCEDCTLSIVVNKIAQQEEGKLDGCYVVKTNIPKESVSAKLAHDRYKDLAKVEFAFRTLKTTVEELRPIYVRKEKRTRGHVLVTMPAYMIVKCITYECVELDYTRKFIIDSLDKIQYLQYNYEGKIIQVIPQTLLPHQTEIK